MATQRPRELLRGVKGFLSKSPLGKGIVGAFLDFGLSVLLGEDPGRAAFLILLPLVLVWEQRFLLVLDRLYQVLAHFLVDLLADTLEIHLVGSYMTCSLLIKNHPLLLRIEILTLARHQSIFLSTNIHIVSFLMMKETLLIRNPVKDRT